MSTDSISIWSKLPTTGTTIFTVMSALAKEHDAINLSQGFPNFDCPPELIDLVHQYMKKGYNQYAPMGGVMALRERIAEKAAKMYGAVVDPNTEVTITSGASEALFSAITAFVRENDEVIVFEPAYDCYEPAIKLSNGKPITITLKAPDYAIPWEDVKKMINGRTKMIILNTPHNPTGSVLSADDLEQLKRIVKGTDILIISDEVYEHMVYDNVQHQSMLLYPSLKNRTILCYSFGKTFHATGWKVGYCIAPAHLTKEIRKIHQFIVFSVNAPVQYALADYLADESHYNYLPQFFQQKRDYFLELIKDSNFTFSPSKGSYFQLLNYSNITDEKDTDFARRLTINNKVAAIPVSPFYNNNLDEKQLRFCFAKTNETLERAAERLCNL